MDVYVDAKLGFSLYYVSATQEEPTKLLGTNTPSFHFQYFLYLFIPCARRPPMLQSTNVEDASHSARTTISTFVYGLLPLFAGEMEADVNKFQLEDIDTILAGRTTKHTVSEGEGTNLFAEAHFDLGQDEDGKMSLEEFYKKYLPQVMAEQEMKKVRTDCAGQPCGAFAGELLV